MLRDVFELLTARRHELPAERLTAEQRRMYWLGYDYALIIACRVLQAAAENHRAVARLRRRIAKVDAAKQREQRERLRLLFTLRCACWLPEPRRFCSAVAKWVLFDGTGRPVELRCNTHRTAGCDELRAEELPAYLEDAEWILDWEAGEISTKKHAR
jgi:hypothetical protein